MRRLSRAHSGRDLFHRDVSSRETQGCRPGLSPTALWACDVDHEACNVGYNGHSISVSPCMISPSTGTSRKCSSTMRLLMLAASRSSWT